MKASVWRRNDFLSEDLKEVKELAKKIFGRTSNQSSANAEALRPDCRDRAGGLRRVAQEGGEHTGTQNPGFSPVSPKRPLRRP